MTSNLCCTCITLVHGSCIAVYIWDCDSPYVWYRFTSRCPPLIMNLSWVTISLVLTLVHFETVRLWKCSYHCVYSFGIWCLWSFWRESCGEIWGRKYWGKFSLLLCYVTTTGFSKLKIISGTRKRRKIVLRTFIHPLSRFMCYLHLPICFLHFIVSLYFSVSFFFFSELIASKLNAHLLLNISVCISYEQGHFLIKPQDSYHI